MDATSAIRPRRRGPKLPELALTDQERATLERWARRRSSSQALAERCRIVLACAEGASNTEVAARLGVARPTVTKSAYSRIVLAPAVHLQPLTCQSTPSTAADPRGLVAVGLYPPGVMRHSVGEEVRCPHVVAVDQLRKKQSPCRS